jgi:hypothetical protein
VALVLCLGLVTESHWVEAVRQTAMASAPRLIGEVSAMTHGDHLALTVEATQRSLEDRLAEALALHRDPQRPRDRYAATDIFMAATSRHMAAIDAVLLRQVRRTVPTGDALVREYLHAASTA